MAENSPNYEKKYLNTLMEETKERGRNESIEFPLFFPTAERIAATANSTEQITGYPYDPIISVLYLYPQANSWWLQLPFCLPLLDTDTVAAPALACAVWV